MIIFTLQKIKTNQLKTNRLFFKNKNNKKMQEIVKIENVTFGFSNYNVLEDISLTIYKNDLIAVIGPNGGGKTTLLRIILGILKPKKGKVLLFGELPKNSRKYVGYLPQVINIDYSFPISVFELVLLGRYPGIMKRNTSEDFLAVKQSLEAVDMYKFKDYHISMLSGGQIQRVLIARALVKKPKLLLLDEPTSGVDQKTQKEFYDLILKLNKDMAIVFVTHDISVVSAYFDKVICLNQKLFYHGPKEGSFGKLEDTYGCPIEIIQKKYLKNIK